MKSYLVSSRGWILGFMALVCATTAQAELARLVMQMEDGISEVRFEAGGSVVATQQLNQAGGCNLVTDDSLLIFDTPTGMPDVGAKFDAIGVQGGSGGTACSAIDNSSRTVAGGETLIMRLNNDGPSANPLLASVSVFVWDLEIELKGQAVVIEARSYGNGSATPNAVFWIRGGDAIGGPVDPGVTAIDCFARRARDRR